MAPPAWTLLSAVLSVAVALLLGWTGAVKAFGPAGELAAESGFAAMRGSPLRAARMLRMVGAAELGVAGVLLTGLGRLAGLAAVVLGIGFLGYLGYVRVAAPGATCGCAGGRSLVTWRSFCRAGWVVLGGAVSMPTAVPWWRTLVTAPELLLAGVAVALAAIVTCSAEADRWWLLPARRLWTGIHRWHRRPPPGGPVPVEASVELVEHSLAWESTLHLVRSSLAEHWLVDGWRILRYAGERREDGGARAVSVLFAVDARSTADVVAAPAVRVAVVAEGTQ